MQTSKSKSTTIVLLAIAFAGSLGYAIISSNHHTEVIAQNTTQVTKVTDEKAELQKRSEEHTSELQSQ